jgi:hypothetical protein
VSGIVLGTGFNEESSCSHGAYFLVNIDREQINEQQIKRLVARAGQRMNINADKD